jgi:glycogen debranching enzyme
LPSSIGKVAHIDLLIEHAGAFEYYVEHAAPLADIPYPTKEVPIAKQADKEAPRESSEHGYFVIEPILDLPCRSQILDTKTNGILPPGKGGDIGSKNQSLSQDGIVLQSFMAKWAGTMSEWTPHLEEASRNGYNMIHYLPLQVRGESNSPYSIAEQDDFAQDLFDAKTGKSSTKQERQATLAQYLKSIKQKYGLLSMVDVVLNHTANNSEWLNDHPEAAYSPYNSPHLTPAEELDRALQEYSNRLGSLGLPTDPKSQSDVDAIVQGIKTHVIDPLRLWEYYAVNVESGKQDFAKAWDSNKSSNVTSLGTDNLTSSSEDDAFQLLNKHGLRNYLAMSERYTTHIDVNVAVAVMKGLYKESPSKETVVEAFGNVLNKVNVNLYAIYDDDVSAILSNISIRLAYFRIEEGGPKLGPITPSSPFCESYFTRLSPDHPSAKKHGADPKRMALANNGWIYNSDPLLDFASNQCRVYLRREVIAWVDCVKLRYGKKPSDCPFLWKHMEQYCVTAATLFDGFRIDNCHSTPMVVGEYFLDVARKANKNLYVCAELFTGSEDLDILFVSKLGINSLIRELTNGPDPVEESRLLYRFGVNKPIGSMDVDCLSTRTKVVVHGGAKKTPIDCTVVPLGGSSPHALFMDLTHDNETPTKLRTPEDHITMAALIAFSYSAIGSNKGFDDVFPDQLNVVSEKRRYEIPVGNEDRGIGAVRRVFNHLHQEMATNGYSEGHVHQEKDYIMMHRIHPQTHEGYLVLAHTAFTKGASGRGEVNPFKFNRTKLQYIMGKTLKITDREPSKDGKILHGLPSKLIDIPSPPIKEGTDDDGFYSELTAPDEFPPGSIMLFSTYMDGLGDDLGTLCQSGAEDAMSSLDLVDLNVVLYRADAEERDATGGNDGAYTIPNLGPLVYCGTEGWMAHLKHITRSNDLGHPLCDHLRKGPWALDYVHNRLERQVKLFPNLAKTAEWFKVRFDKIRETAPSFLRPKYFALVLVTASRVARQRAISQMSDFVKEGDDFTQSLALCAVQMNGQVQSSSLWHDRPSASMAAGLPFFATSWARLWGRDVFISLRGLYLTTQMSQAAKEHILSFGCTLWNGLIPNLLNSTTNPRYNCRDGPWFFAQNIQDYVRKVPGGEAILQEKIKRRFPLDGEWVEVDSSKAFSQTSTLAEILQEILQRHASGIHFREHNAGPDIDGDMTDNGFNIDIEVDWKTGFVMGGNPDNCGTWQDKMGSSAKAKNKGVPGSSREGAAVEITGLLKSTLRWVDELSGKGKWHAKGVKAKIDGSETEISFRKWGDLIQAAFEKNYWVPLDSSEDSSYNVKTSLINRRGIYKDVFGSSAGREWCDYQLRANFPMAMCVAPELFDASHAVTALQAADHALRDTIGMKTLDPNDRNFHGVYDNSNDTDDYWMAKGFCYHNGPPWIFPFGFFLRAFLIFDQKAGSGTISKTNTWWRAMSMLGAHRRHIETSPWAGLPELTNADGQECSDSCPTQAWSASTILDALELVREQSQAM